MIYCWYLNDGIRIGATRQQYSQQSKVSYCGSTGQDNRPTLCIGEKETIERLIIECSQYGEQRRELEGSVTSVVAAEQWQRRLDQQDGDV